MIFYYQKPGRLSDFPLNFGSIKIKLEFDWLHSDSLRSQVTAVRIVAQQRLLGD